MTSWFSVYHISPCLHPIFTISTGSHWRRAVVSLLFPSAWNPDRWNFGLRLRRIRAPGCWKCPESYWSELLARMPEKVHLPSCDIRIMRLKLLPKQLFIFYFIFKRFFQCQERGDTQILRSNAYVTNGWATAFALLQEVLTLGDLLLISGSRHQEAHLEMWAKGEFNMTEI